MLMVVFCGWWLIYFFLSTFLYFFNFSGYGMCYFYSQYFILQEKKCFILQERQQKTIELITATVTG